MLEKAVRPSMERGLGQVFDVSGRLVSGGDSMKYYPQTEIEIEVNDRAATVAVNACPFCGEPLEIQARHYPYEIERVYDHSPWRCDPNEDRILATWTDESDLRHVAVLDDDGDVWLFWEYMDYEEKYFHISPFSGQAFKNLKDSLEALELRTEGCREAFKKIKEVLS
jgi:hypothetical protein